MNKNYNLIITIPNIPVLKEMLDKAVKEEKYEEAARLRDIINPKKTKPCHKK